MTIRRLLILLVLTSTYHTLLCFQSGGPNLARNTATIKHRHHIGPLLGKKKASSKKGFVKPGQGKGYNGKTVVDPAPSTVDIPALSSEVLTTRIPIDSSDEPPTLSQIESRLETLYGFSPSLSSLSSSLKCLHFDPLILTVDDFFTSEQCDSYVQKAVDDTGLRSPTVGKDAASKDHRTSTTWHHKYEDAPELLAGVCGVLGLEVGDKGEGLKRFEEPQTVRYRRSERFNWHYDALGMTSGEVKKGRDGNSKAGQRMATVLVYLADVEGGGATAFRDLGVKVKPEKGKACIFFPSLGGIEDCPCDLRTVHAGEPNESENADKWIAQIWVREEPTYEATVPEGSRAEDAADSVRELMAS
ncbi:hypothetical protein TrST_g1797 [Triparma strigata]|uniref:Fe2OG dioxygenase domain-containing protein n=1 Tax=Triparma strigata TaxID=1606541 RepID=A0A9W7EWE3_9STRA|nr:hypothetical protein TrST_g1797 [Triparma strigata]